MLPRVPALTTVAIGVFSLVCARADLHHAALMLMTAATPTSARAARRQALLGRPDAKARSSR
jgi:hypothetical protein